MATKPSRLKGKDIHSEFRCRMLLSVRAPKGDDPQAKLAQDLVRELEIRHVMGTHNEWIIQALMDRMKREKLAGIGIAGSDVEAQNAARPNMAAPAPERPVDRSQSLGVELVAAASQEEVKPLPDGGLAQESSVSNRVKPNVNTVGGGLRSEELPAVSDGDGRKGQPSTGEAPESRPVVAQRSSAEVKRGLPPGLRVMG